MPRRPNGKLDRLRRAADAGQHAGAEGLEPERNPFTLMAHREAWEASRMAAANAETANYQAVARRRAAA